MPSLVAKQNTFVLVLVSMLVLIGTGNSLARAADNDHDGMDDAIDRCPNTQQLKKLPSHFKYGVAVNPDRLKPGPQAYPVDQYGCEPDSDADGVVNSQDYCPHNTKDQLVMGVASNGCPIHSDADGTPDYRDHCPDTPRGVKTDQYGCEVKNKA